MGRFIFLFSFLLLFTCKGKQETSVLYINSYHEGYPSSDEIMRGIQETFSGEKVDLRIEFMDSKRNSDPEYLENKAFEMYTSAKKKNPDIIILSDDNAVKYFGQEYAIKIDCPLIFCGVNWSHHNYDLPAGNYTGMLEVLPVKECIDLARENNPQIRKLGILSENSLSEQKNIAILDTLTKLENTYLLADNFDGWKKMFLELNDSCDLIFLPTNGAIKNWDPEEAEKFVRENIEVPVFTCDDFMMPYCVFGMTKIAREQGEWAAEQTLKILNGRNVSNIAVTKNSRFEYRLNAELAGKTAFKTNENINFIFINNEN